MNLRRINDLELVH